jgi:isochorismate hydrolase
MDLNLVNYIITRRGPAQLEEYIAILSTSLPPEEADRWRRVAREHWEGVVKRAAERQAYWDALTPADIKAIKARLDATREEPLAVQLAKWK